MWLPSFFCPPQKDTLPPMTRGDAVSPVEMLSALGGARHAVEWQQRCQKAMRDIKELLQMGCQVVGMMMMMMMMLLLLLLPLLQFSFSSSRWSHWYG